MAPAAGVCAVTVGGGATPLADVEDDIHPVIGARRRCCSGNRRLAIDINTVARGPPWTSGRFGHSIVHGADRWSLRR